MKLIEFVSAADLKRIENDLNDIWDEDGVEINMHTTGSEANGESHFLQRVNDNRNKPPIEAQEIEDIFKTAHDFKTPRNKLKHMQSGKEAVLTDPETKVNIPVIAKTDKWGNETKIIPKTVMRKSDFKTGTDKINLPFTSQRKVEPPKKIEPKQAETDELPLSDEELERLTAPDERINETPAYLTREKVKINKKGWQVPLNKKGFGV